MVFTEVFTERTPRVVAARKLTRRSRRYEQRLFLAEGANALHSALLYEQDNPGSIQEIFVTEERVTHYADVISLAEAANVTVSCITERAAKDLTETVSPQGIVAVCAMLNQPLEAVITPKTRLVAVLAEVSDPGNAGTVIRIADAAGADAVIIAGDSVDIYNGKCVRASAGSVFNLPISTVPSATEAVDGCRAAGLRLLAAHGYSSTELPDVDLRPRSAWIFGNEAHGLDDETLRSVDIGVRIPLYGKAESLNLAAAAAVSLYASAMTHVRQG